MIKQRKDFPQSEVESMLEVVWEFHRDILTTTRIGDFTEYVDLHNRADEYLIVLQTGIFLHHVSKDFPAHRKEAILYKMLDLLVSKYAYRKFHVAPIESSFPRWDAIIIWGS